MGINEKNPKEDKTYHEILFNTLSGQLGYEPCFYDSEEIFIEFIFDKIRELQDNIMYRKKVLTGEQASFFSVNYQLINLKQRIEIRCNKFIGCNDPVSISKHKVLMATLQFLDDGNEEKLDCIIKKNPSYKQASSIRTSQTLVLISQAKELIKKKYSLESHSDSKQATSTEKPSLYATSASPTTSSSPHSMPVLKPQHSSNMYRFFTAKAVSPSEAKMDTEPAKKERIHSNR